MDKHKLYDYYIEKDYNCAEAVLRTANEEYGLNLDETALRLVSGFGGGMGCGDACGALCGAMAVISALLVEGRAHGTDGFPDKCGTFARRFEQKEGSTRCDAVKPVNFAEGSRCFKTVEDAYVLLEQFLKEEGRI